MIFSRRAIQRRLNELRGVFDCSAVDKLATRLNAPSKDRLAAMWEVVILHGLMRCGTIFHELQLPSGKCPDVTFNNETLRFTADITTVSDNGLDGNNPVAELHNLIEVAKTKLGFPPGGMNLNVLSTQEQTSRGIKTVLRLPPRKDLNAFVSKQIVPRLREQKTAGNKVCDIKIDDDTVGISLVIDPARTPSSTIGYASYDVPRILTKNPIYKSLEKKVLQLRGAEGVSGVIVCDGDCTALADRKTGWNEVSAIEVAEEFLRQYTSIDFVLFFTISEVSQTWPVSLAPQRKMKQSLVVREGFRHKEALNSLFAAMLAEFPKPVAMPATGAMRARESGYDLGHMGGYTVCGNKIRISSRELMEVLAGLRTLADNGAKNIAASRKTLGDVNRAQNAFLRNLNQGRLPVSVSVIRTDEDDNDDWVVFEFGDPDPSISPLY